MIEIIGDGSEAGGRGDFSHPARRPMSCLLALEAGGSSAARAHGSEMGLGGSDSRWRAAGRWTLLRQGLRVVLCLLGVIWTAVTVAWLRLGHPLNALVTALIVVAQLLWVVRTGHAGRTPEADDAWSRQAVPVGAIVTVFSLAALSPSRSTSPSGAVVALSLVLWSCVVLAVWLTGTPSSAATGRRHPLARRAADRQVQGRTG